MTDEGGDMTLVRGAAQTIQAHIQSLEAENAALKAENVKWKRIRTPTHGTCCTCQACGLDYDSCRCDVDEVADELTQAKNKHAALTSLLADIHERMMNTYQGVPDANNRIPFTGSEMDEIGRLLKEA